jgi:hypothetical protein
MAISKISRKKDPLSRMIMLWLYEHGWEDPDWGTVNGQLALQVSLLEISAHLTDKRLQTQMRTALKGAIAQTAGAIK